MGVQGYYGSVFNNTTKTLTMSADISYVEMDTWLNGKSVYFKEDPRLTLIHEMSHFINKPEEIEEMDMWLEEGIAYYLSFNYQFEEIDTDKFPEEAKQRKLLDFVLFMNDKGYDYKLGISNIIKDAFPSSNYESKATVFIFQGLARMHYGMGNLDGIPVGIFESRIVGFLVDNYGKDKLVELYGNIHAKDREYSLNDEVVKVYGVSAGTLEGQWRSYVGLDNDYRKIMNWYKTSRYVVILRDFISSKHQCAMI